MSPPRVLFYCHNVLGFGHIIRSLRIAGQLAGRAEVRLVTGCRFLDRIHVPDNVEVVLLPALRAEPDGRLTPVDGGFLGGALRKRGKLIAQEVRTWQPHVLLVDHNPLGLMAELVETLDAIHAERLRTRLVWGIRDIWSSPEHLKTMLGAFAGDPDAIRDRILRYHSAIAYTDAAWLETLDRYRDFALPARTESVGFVTEPVAPPAPAIEPIIAVLSGGGEAAPRLTALVLEAAPATRLRIVVGPFSKPDDVRAQTGNRGDVEVWPEGTVEDAIRDAAHVVCRAGYNTAYTVVQSDLPVTFVPLRGGGEEQALRASRLAELDRVESIDERDSDAARQLRDSIARGLAAGPGRRALPFSTDGARRAAGWLLGAAAEAMHETAAVHRG